MVGETGCRKGLEEARCFRGWAQVRAAQCPPVCRVPDGCHQPCHTSSWRRALSLAVWCSRLFRLIGIPGRDLECPGNPLNRVSLLSVCLWILSTSLPSSTTSLALPDLSQLESMFTVAALPLSNLGCSPDSSPLIYCGINPQPLK